MDPWITLYIICGVFILPCLILGSVAQSSVYSTFESVSKINAKSGITAAELSRKLLTMAGAEVDVAEINGKLTDHYDPRYKVIKLSHDTYNSTSVAALAVCAHEVGHAIQHHNKNFIFRLRSFLAPVLSFISKAFVPLILLGSILSFMFFIPSVGYYIVLCSIVVYGASLLFQLVTLPLEYDASSRALKLLEQTNVLDRDELVPAKKVLKAAIMTYVAATLTSLIYFLRFLSYAMIFRRNDR